ESSNMKGEEEGSTCSNCSTSDSRNGTSLTQDCWEEQRDAATERKVLDRAMESLEKKATVFIEKKVSEKLVAARELRNEDVCKPAGVVSPKLSRILLTHVEKTRIIKDVK
ncbi:hypothetical protein AVEN_36451-1, partial [Araneus ventricosus]